MYQVRMELKGADPVERFFDNIQDRNEFVNEFEKEMHGKAIKLEKYLEHFCFVTFKLIKRSEEIGDITIYR